MRTPLRFRRTTQASPRLARQRLKRRIARTFEISRTLPFFSRPRFRPRLTAQATTIPLSLREICSTTVRERALPAVRVSSWTTTARNLRARRFPGRGLLRAFTSLSWNRHASYSAWNLSILRSAFTSVARVASSFMPSSARMEAFSLCRSSAATRSSFNPRSTRFVSGAISRLSSMDNPSKWIHTSQSCTPCTSDAGQSQIPPSAVTHRGRAGISYSRITATEACLEPRDSLSQSILRTSPPRFVRSPQCPMNCGAYSSRKITIPSTTLLHCAAWNSPRSRAGTDPNCRSSFDER